MMAKKPPAIESEPEADPKRSSNKALLEECRKNFKLDIEADRENRDKYRESMKFCYEPGGQWEDSVKRARGKKRITREFNETRVKVKSVVNHIRANRPAAKINPVEKGDIDTAEAMNGIWLNILNTSNADDITDFAAETQVAAGMGAWFVDTEYCEGSVDQQDIYLRSIRNPLCLVPDRNSKEQDKSDANHWNLYTNLSKTAYEAKYGKADKVASFEADDMDQDTNPQVDDDSVWVTAYWRKEPITKTLCRLVTGETVDKATLSPEQLANIAVSEDGKPIERTFRSHKIVQYICSATEVIERNEWAGKEFPFVVVYGEYVVIDGKTCWSGITPYMMDAQRSHNETLTGVYETIALAPQAKYWATPEQAKGNMAQWNTAVEENLQVMLYNVDPKAPGPPPRVGGADVPAALMQASQMSRDSMKSVSGIFDASLGEVSNETSGRAIRARQDQSLIVTYNYSDNMSKAIGRTCAIVLDLIPKIIDTERAYRILGKDGAEKYIVVNRRDPVTGQIVENDLSRGKYDFVVTQSPSVQTQRQEATEAYSQLSQANPVLQAAAGDIIFENMDLPGAKQVAERLKLMLPPQIQQAINQDGGSDPQVMAAMAQVEALQQQIQEQAAMVEQAAQEAQTEKSAADKAKADAQLASANLKTQEAELGKAVAEFQRLVAETQAKMAAEQGQQSEATAADKDVLVQQVSEALAAIQQQAQEFTQAFSEQMALLQQQTMQGMELAAAANSKPRGNKVVQLSRANGGFTGRIVELDESGQPMSAKTVNLARQPGGTFAGEISEAVQ